MKVYQAIGKVAARLSKDGISKSRENKAQGFKFRGIDETLNTLAPILSEEALVILPRMVARTVTERESRNGGVLFSVVVEAEFDFVSCEDGSTHTVRTFGEAMDSGDKATNKAMSIAYKYAAFLAFCIPVEAMAPDADTEVHEVKPSQPEGYATWIKKLDTAAAKGKATMSEVYKEGTQEFGHYLKTHDGYTLTALTDKANASAKAAA